jgi:hypothetical protein
MFSADYYKGWKDGFKNGENSVYYKAVEDGVFYGSLIEFERISRLSWWKRLFKQF